MTTPTRYRQEAPETIQQMFDDIAPTYDRCNSIISFRLHELWVGTLVRKVLLPTAPGTLLDLCAGTGDVAFRYLDKRQSPTSATLLDFSSSMLEIARHHATSEQYAMHNVSCIQADAQQLPVEDNSFDAVTIAYGIRNIKDPASTCREALRVLKPGGTFAILELTRPSNGLLRWGHSLYLRRLVPVVAGWISHNREAYEYLCSSIHRLAPATHFSGILTDLGYDNVWHRQLCGGIASLIVGQKRSTQ